METERWCNPLPLPPDPLPDFEQFYMLAHRVWFDPCSGEREKLLAWALLRSLGWIRRAEELFSEE